MSTDTNRKILVVDDELDTRIFVSTLLNACGFLPVTAENKIEGFAWPLWKNRPLSSST